MKTTKSWLSKMTLERRKEKRNKKFSFNFFCCLAKEKPKIFLYSLKIHHVLENNKNFIRISFSNRQWIPFFFSWKNKGNNLLPSFMNPMKNIYFHAFKMIKLILKFTKQTGRKRSLVLQLPEIVVNMK